MFVPKEKPVIENLNSYYLNIKKLLEHYQGEIGAGGISFKSSSAAGIIFFDHDDILNGCFEERKEKITGEEAIERLMDDESEYNFLVDIYQLPPEDVYFWSSMPTAEIKHSDLSTDFTDLQGLLKKMTAEKLTGFIDVTIGDGSEQGLVFISNGEIIGGSFSWGKGQSGGVKKDIGKLVEKTKASGGLFQVSRIPLADKESDSSDENGDAAASDVIRVLEEFLVIFETLYTSKKPKSGGFNSIIRKKFVEKAEQYAFLDPFAAEFEYADRKIRFTGHADDEELAAGVTASVQELAEELDLDDQFKQHLSSWSGKHKKILKRLGVRL